MSTTSIAAMAELQVKQESDEAVDEEDNAGQTALHIAVMKNDLESVKVLLSYGANANQKTHVTSEDDEVSLDCECAYCSYCFHVADEYGNEMKGGNVVGQNSLHLAAKHSSVEIVSLMLESIENVDESSDDGSTALHYATQNCTEDDSDISVSKLLLRYGADIDSRNKDGKTPLYLAVKFEKQRLVEYLISMGADVNAYTNRRSTPLYSALINCNIELVKLLLENNVSVDTKNDHDEDFLFYVIRVVNNGYTRLRLIELLLDHGIKVDSRNGHGSTALHLAVQSRDEELTRLLIDRGCPIDSKDCFDMSPLAIAVCTNLENEAKLLLELGADVNGFINSSSILEHAIIRRNEAMVRLLLQYKANVDIGSERNKPVVAACLHKNTQIMQMLIDKGADINCKDKRGRTPLMRTMKLSNYLMMRHLLEHGACINERDYSGNSAFHVLFENNSHTKESIIEYLLEQGADLNIENDRGYTPFNFMMFKCFTKGEVFIFIKHVALLLVQNRHVNPKIIRILKKDKTWNDFLTSCGYEVERMKDTRVLEKITYLDIIIKRYNALAPLFQMKDALRTIQRGIRNYLIYKYSDILIRNFKRKSEQLRLIEQNFNILSEIFRNVLPPEIVENICQYLSNWDLSVVAKKEEECGKEDPVSIYDFEYGYIRII